MLERFPGLDVFTNDEIYFGDPAVVKEMIEQRYAKDESNRKKMLALLAKIAEGDPPNLISIAPRIKEAKAKAGQKTP